MITGAQIRAARAALAWSAQDLADRASVGHRTIMRFETSNGLPSGRSETLLKLQKTLEAAGIEFIGSPGKNPGIIIKS